jgi:hypothetical protein
MGPRSYDAANCSITHLQFLTDDTSGSAALWSVGCVLDFNYVSHLDEDDDMDPGARQLVGAADLALQ